MDQGHYQEASALLMLLGAAPLASARPPSPGAPSSSVPPSPSVSAVPVVPALLLESLPPRAAVATALAASCVGARPFC